MKQNRIHKIIFLGIFLLLSFPLLQKFLSFYESDALKGAVTTHSEPTFSWTDWWSGSFQENQEKYAKDNIGTRADLVRLNNQIDYSLFSKINAKNVVVGKEGYLFESGYIDGYFGTNFLGKKLIEFKVNKIKKIQDTLAQLNKTLIVILAPGKASHLPEYLPKEYDGVKKQLTNYTYFKTQFEEKGINHIDMNRWFLDMKDHSLPLYSKTGVHWSSYGDFVVADSLIRYLENIRQVDLPELVGHKTVWHHPPIKRDRDIEDGMNLIWMLESDSMPDVEHEFIVETPSPIKGMVISDSYYWGLHYMGFTDKILNGGHFWFYNNEIYPNLGGHNRVKNLNLEEEVMKKDVIILITTEISHPHFCWGFIEKFYSILFPEDKQANERREKIELKIEEIIKHETWMEEIKAKAKVRNISLDSMLYLDAEYLLEYN